MPEARLQRTRDNYRDPLWLEGKRWREEELRGTAAWMATWDTRVRAAAQAADDADDAHDDRTMK